MNAAKGLLILVTALLVSCGGGGSSSTQVPPPADTTPPPSNGIDRGGVTRGVITGFGSIFVNGIRFDTSAAMFTIDDMPGGESDLAVGKVVTVLGAIDDDGENGSADEVFFDDEVEGPIESIDAGVDTGMLVVMGQTVVVNAETQFDDSIVPNSLEGLSVGQVVEVSGFVGADGSITATHIELTNDDDFEVTGIVTGLDTGAMTFMINGLVVDYSGATLEDFPDGQIANDLRVEAEGTMFGPGGELIATSVEFEGDDLPFDNDDGDDDIEVEGLITRFASATDFDVAGFAVTTTDSTVFEYGSADDLAVGVRVEVEGFRDDAGVLVADTVSFRLRGDIEIEAPVEVVDADGGRVTVLALIVATTATTQLEDDSTQELATFSLQDLSVGDWVEIKAFKDGAGNLVATQLERIDAEEEVSVEAPVDLVARPDLVVLGLTIQTDDNTQYEGIDDLPMSADDFFAAVAAGSEVQVRGNVVSDGVILASEIELEADD